MPVLTFKGMRTFAGFLKDGEKRSRAEQAKTARLAAARLLVIARGLYGNKSVLRGLAETPPLRDLRETTQDERVALDYAANEPLLRDGSLLRDSVRAFSTPTLAVIESNEKIAAYHEFGYVTQPFGNKFIEPVYVPPRPVFRYTMMAAAPYINKRQGQAAKKVLGFE